MTTEQFYRRATVLPFVAAAAAAIGMNTIAPGRDAVSSALFGTSALLVFASFYAIIPYALFLIAVWLFVRPKGESALRRTALLAPIVIAIPFAVVFASWGGIVSPESFYDALIFAGLTSLALGYVYVLVIETALLVLKKSGVVHHAEAA